MGNERPKRNSKEVLEEAAKRLLPRVMEWLSRDGGQSVDADEVREQLAKAIRYDDDGYQIAKELDNAGWFEIDADLVEILDAASHHKWEAHAALVKAWVAESSIATPLAIGAKVKTPKGDGVIADVNLDTAQYVVQTAERAWSGAQSGWVFSVEECEAVA